MILVLFWAIYLATSYFSKTKKWTEITKAFFFTILFPTRAYLALFKILPCKKVVAFFFLFLETTVKVSEIKFTVSWKLIFKSKCINSIFLPITSFKKYHLENTFSI